MRTIPAEITNAIGSPRSVNLRYTAIDNRLRFDVQVLDDSLGQSHSALADVSAYGTGVLRATNFNDVLYYQVIPDLAASSFTNWVNTGIALKAGSKPGVSGGWIWYQENTGAIRSVEYNGSLGAPGTRSTAFTTRTVTCAPVSSSECFIHYLDGTWGAVARIKVGSSVAYWPGRVYGAITSAHQFDAVQLNGISYLYLSDDDNGRIAELSYNNGAWGQLEYMIPLDIVDDTSFYKLAYATVIDGKVFVTARISRPNDAATVAFDAFFIGPRPFSMGREMFITADTVMGKLFLDGETVYYLGINEICEAPATETVGVQNASLRTTSEDIASLEMSHAAYRPMMCSMDVPASASHVALSSTSEMVIEAGFNGYWAELGRFVIDTIEKPRDLASGAQLLNIAGAGTYKLATWTPDMNFDLTGHGYLSSAPHDLKSVVRARGIWEVSNGSLAMDYRNELGVLYGSNRPSRGGMARAKFLNPSGSADWLPEYGVAINYRQEAKYEAAERLGVDLEAVNQDDFGDNGIVAIYEPDHHQGGEGIGLYSWIDGSLNLLTSESFSIPADTWHWLSIYFVDGSIRVMYRLDSAATWTTVLTHTYDDTEMPWKKDYRGHGAVYLNNKTTSAYAYNFRSSSMVIPIADPSDLPASGVLEMGSEQIYFDGIVGTTGLENGDELSFVPDVYFRNDDAADFTGKPIVLDTAGAVANKDAYDGFAAVVTEGPGKGTVFTVSDYDYETPQLWVPSQTYTLPDIWQNHVGEDGHGSWANSNMRRIFVSDSFVSGLGEGTKIRVVPAAVVMARGYNDTPSSTHSGGMIGVYQDLSVKIDWFECYDSETARRLEDFFEMIGAHAGVNNIQFEKRLSGTINMPGAGWNLSSCFGEAKTCIPLFDVPALSAGMEAGVVFRLPEIPASLDKAGGDLTDFENQFFGNLTKVGSKIGITYQAGLVGNYGVQMQAYDTNPRYLQYNAGSLQTEVTAAFYFDPNTLSLGSGGQMVLLDIVNGCRLYYNDAGSLTLQYYDNAGALQGAGTYSLAEGTNKIVVDYRAGSGDGHARLILNELEVLTADNLTNDLRTAQYVRLGMVDLIPAAASGIMYVDHYAYSLGGADAGYMVTLYYDGTDYYLRFRSTDSSAWSLREEVKLWFAPQGTIRVAVIDDHYSVWINGLYVHTFRDGAWSEGQYAGYVMYGAGSMDVDFSAIDHHVESVILDTKTSGHDILSEEARKRRVFTVCDQNGSMRVFKTFSDVGTLPDIVFSYQPTEFGIAAPTRLRGEGMNVVEIADYKLMKELGNLFALFNAEMADDLRSTVQATEREIIYQRQMTQQAAFDIAIDWRLEAGDVATFQLPDGNKKYEIVETKIRVAVNAEGSELMVSEALKVLRHQDELV